MLNINMAQHNEEIQYFREFPVDPRGQQQLSFTGTRNWRQKMITLTMMTPSLIFIVGFLIFQSTTRAEVPTDTKVTSNRIISPNSMNLIFDIFLTRYTSSFATEEKALIKMSGFQRTFLTKMLSMDINGNMEVSDGWCTKNRSIQRIGDAKVETVEEDIILSATVGLGALNIDYSDYNISFLGVRQEGRIHVAVEDNFLALKMRMQLNPHCTISLTEVKIETPKFIIVNITNLGIFQDLRDDIDSWLTDEVNIWRIAHIEETLISKISKEEKRC